jgi:hypothetical protein
MTSANKGRELIIEKAPDFYNNEEQSNNSVAEESSNEEEIIRKTAKKSQIKAPKTKKKIQIEDDDEDEEIVAKETNKRKYTKNTNKLVPKPSIRPIKVPEQPDNQEGLRRSTRTRVQRDKFERAIYETEYIIDCEGKSVRTKKVVATQRLDNDLIRHEMKVLGINNLKASSKNKEKPKSNGKYKKIVSSSNESSSEEDDRKISKSQKIKQAKRVAKIVSSDSENGNF